MEQIDGARPSLITVFCCNTNPDLVVAIRALGYCPSEVELASQGSTWQSIGADFSFKSTCIQSFLFQSKFVDIDRKPAVVSRDIQ